MNFNGYSYFARMATTLGPIKIGRAQAPLARIKELGYQFDREMELLAVVPDGRLERRFHALFLDDHLGSEWFEYSKPLRAMIDQILCGYFNPASLPCGKTPRLCALPEGLLDGLGVQRKWKSALRLAKRKRVDLPEGFLA